MIELFLTLIMQTTDRVNVVGLIRLYDVILLLLIVYLILRKQFFYFNKTIAFLIMFRIIYILISLLFLGKFNFGQIMSIGYFIEFAGILFIMYNIKLDFVRLWNIGIKASIICFSIAILQSILSNGMIRGYGWAGPAFTLFFLPFMIFPLLSKRKDKLTNLSFLLGILATILSQQRTLFSVLLLTYCISFLLTKNLKKKLKFIFYIIVGICFLIVLMNFIPDHLVSNIELKIQEIFNSNLNSNNTIGIRFRLWYTAILLFKANPLIGIGSGSFARIANEASLSDYTALISGEVGLSTHNQLLEFLAELGIIGVLLTYGMIIYILFYIYSEAKKYNLLRDPIFISLYSSIIALSLYDIYGQSIFYTFWCYILLLNFAYIKHKKNELLNLANYE